MIATLRSSGLATSARPGTEEDLSTDTDILSVYRQSEGTGPRLAQGAVSTGGCREGTKSRLHSPNAACNSYGRADLKPCSTASSDVREQIAGTIAELLVVGHLLRERSCVAILRQ